MSWLHVTRAPGVGSRRTTSSPTTQAVQGGDVLSEVIDYTSTALQRAQQQWRTLFTGSSPNADTSRMERPTQRPTSLTSENMRTNQSWGDEIQAKPHHITRIYAINLNGIPLDARGGQFDTACRVLKEIQADVFCGQEHNLDTTQAPLRKILYDTASQHWERNRVTLGSTPIPFQRQYKPGGTMLMTVGSLTGRVCKQVRDKWGRWTCQEFQGQAQRRLIIISAYQPIFKSSQVGKITVAAQHISLLMRTQDQVHNPRVAFRRDLTACLKDYHSQGFDILLVGDFNEALGSDPDGMSKIAGDFDLVDLMSGRHSSNPPATYARGTKRLDYALASARVFDALEHAGYEAFNSRIASDHRGYFMDFHTEALFGSSTQNLANRANRTLSSSNTVQVTAYIRRKYELLIQCNAFERAQKLSTASRRPTRVCGAP